MGANESDFLVVDDICHVGGGTFWEFLLCVSREGPEKVHITCMCAVGP